MRSICIIFFLSLICNASAQDTIQTDKPQPQIKVKKNNSPRIASILSAVLPGAGQVYNRKYWKPPIIYAGLGGFGYFFLKNQNQYTYYRKNLIALIGGDSTVIEKTGYNSDQLQTEKLTYRKHRDLFGFALIAVYAINIIDANVDAHLKTFDVSDDLSLELNAKPILVGSATGLTCGAGISLKLNFK